MQSVAEAGISLLVRDISGQKRKRVSNVPADATVGELVDGLTSRLGLPRNDVEGRDLTYEVRLDREDRFLQPSERVREALREEDEVVLMRNVDAG